MTITISKISNTVLGALVAITLLAAPCGDAHAQDKSSNETMADDPYAEKTPAGSEKTLLSEGDAALAAKDHDTAVARFRSALANNESPHALGGLALALEGAGDCVSALENAGRAMSNRDNWVRKNRRPLRHLKRDCKNKVGTLTVEGGIPGALVTVNDHEVGSLPLSEPVNVNAGSVMVAVTADGHVPFEKTLEVAGMVGETITVALEPIPEPTGPPTPEPVEPIAGEENEESAGPPPQTEVAEAKSFLVQRVEAVGVEEDLAHSVEEALVLDLGRRKNISVVTSAEMEQTVKFTQTKAELGCNEVEACMVEVRKKLDVDLLLAGKLAKLGNEYLLTLNTVDVNNSSVDKRVNIQATDFDGIKKQIPDAMNQILGIAETRKTFRMPAGSKLKLAVMPLSDRGVPISTADAMTQILSAELNQIEGISVISRDDISAMLDKVALEAETGCTENVECIVEIGAALGLSKMVTGTVGKVKDTFVISVQLVDTRNADVQNRVLESFAGDQDELKHATKLVAYELVGVEYRDRLGKVDFSFDVEEAEVRLGDSTGKLLSSQFQLADLEPGRYSLRIIADPDDYFPLQTDIYVAPGATNIRTFVVPERPTPWYKTWWFWTATGVVLAAGAVITVYFVTADDPPLGEGAVTVGIF